jgi:hypothetical protein
MKQALLGLGLVVTAAAVSPVSSPPVVTDGPRSATPR